MPELNPCPFCKTEGRPKLTYGFATVHNSTDPQHPIRTTRYHVFCQDCRAVGPETETAEQAIELWNTRYEPTCTMEFQDNGYSKWWECSNCQDTEWYPSLRRCPTCGARVVDGDA